MSKEAEKPDSTKTINVGEGKGERFTEGPERKKMWDVEWEEARVNYSEGGKFGGVMQKVKGTLSDKAGQVVARYEARRASADQQTGILTLDGDVKLTSLEQKATLSCRQVVWHYKEELVKAKGDVRIKSPQFEMGSLAELWASPDLDQVATPDLFKRK